MEQVRSMGRFSTEVVVDMQEGLHARPAMKFVDVATTFASRITVHRDENSADGKSIMHMMTLEAVQGSTLKIEAEGEDAEQAIATLKKLFEDKFPEG